MDKFLVLGGSGFVGTSLCERLVARAQGGGGPITIPTRHPARAKHLQSLPTVRLKQADIFEPGRLVGLLAGHDAVVNLVAILHGSEAEFTRVHVELPSLLADACRASGVDRIVHVSALGAASDAPSRYLRSKAGGEAALRASGLDVTLLRPSVIFGARDRFLNLFARMQRVLPMMPLAGATARFQPVWVADVADAIVRCLDRPSTIGQTYECAGPRQYALRDLVQLAGRWSGHERPVIGLPDGIARLQAGLLEMLPGEPLMSRDNLDSMKVPNVASGRLPGLEQLGIVAATLDSVAPGYLGRG
ncbi:MAG: complex I NDUFA9 subunit family protein [Proteobacteria bacterium]|nr:complex I NDUFA9 subunit family protein [Pseudomonadota bacterium]